MKKILIYQDYVHNNGVLFKRLRQTYGTGQVEFCDARDIIDGVLTVDISLFVMPGGADIYYCEKLNGDGNEAIRKYVENGGQYLGVCAGAFYAASEIDWGRGEICGPRELKFFDGTATGPVYDFIEDGDIKKSWQNIVDIRIGDIVYPSLYFGGPFFQDVPDPLGVHDDGTAAIIKNKIGKGTVILTSPHIEYRPQDLKNTTYRHWNKSFEWSNAAIEKFDSKYDAQNDIWQRVMKEFE